MKLVPSPGRRADAGRGALAQLPQTPPRFPSPGFTLDALAIRSHGLCLSYPETGSTSMVNAAPDSDRIHCSKICNVLGKARNRRTQRWQHDFARRPSIRCFTSCQETPADSPAKTCRARRSISPAQALSTSSRLSTGFSSRVASSSAARSSRLLWRSFSASCKRVSRVMGSSLPSDAKLPGE